MTFIVMRGLMPRINPLLRPDAVGGAVTGRPAGRAGGAEPAGDEKLVTVSELAP